jgi:ParB family chromosome partitioning protein
MSVQHWLTYRGAVRALVSEGESLVFVTAHAEGQPTALYKLDPLRGHLESQPLPGGLALAGSAARWWVVDPSGQLHAGPFGQLAPVGTRFEPVPAAIVALPSGAVALLVGSALVLLDPQGQELRRVPLDTMGSALAVDSTGTFLVAGSVDGTMTVLSHEGHARPTDFEVKASAQLHQGTVLALHFEPEEPRFHSLGTDGRFLLTHARGALEPLERTGRSGQSTSGQALALYGSAVYTAGPDGLKIWPRDSQREPSTVTTGVGKAMALTTVLVEGKPHLAVASRDDTLRLFPIDPQTGKLRDRSHRFYGAIGRARRELMRSDVARRRAALDALASYDDAEAIALIVERIGAETDHALQVHAVTLLGRSANPRAGAPLEGLLQAPSEAVRRTALEHSAQKHEQGPGRLRVLNRALSTGHPDIGTEAVAGLQRLIASKDVRAPEAQAALLGALDHGAAAVRERALEALEGLAPSASPEASLLGMRSRVALLRWKAALRLLQRGLLGDPAVRLALRSLTEDTDAEVRQLAYHLLLLGEPLLAARLRCEDPDLHRNLYALEHHGEERSQMPPEPVRPQQEPGSLSVLLQAASSRKPDTALRGASHLAVLGDGRAFGVLLQLSREAQPDIAVRVCKAFERLADPRALGRLKAMLRANTASVRDAAFSALRRLWSDTPLLAAQAGLLAPAVDVRHRGLSVLIEQLKAAQSSWSLPAGALELLRSALNDPDPKLRADAFKATLSLGAGHAGPGGLERSIDLGGPGALRFVLSSIHLDLRREVLTEIMADIGQPWAWQMLLELFDDPHPELRNEAFSFARKQAKTEQQEHEVVAAALRSRFPDLRLLSISVLAERMQDHTLPLLVGVLDDDEERVRTLAFDAIQRAGALDAIASALHSRHPDVHMRAARSLAERGSPEALQPLLSQLEKPRPEVAELEKRWVEFVKQALEGLAALQDKAATEPVVRLLHDKDPSLRLAAAHALSWLAAPEDLRAQLTHPDEAVRRQLATGLAWLGDPVGATLVFTPQGPPLHRVAAALALGDEDQLLALLDDPTPQASELALKVLVLHDWAGSGFPDLLLAALSAQSPRVRLAVAQLLEVWSDEPALQSAVIRQLSQPSLPNPRKDLRWPLDPAVVRKLALAVRSCTGRDRVAALEVLARTGERANSTAEAAQAAALVAHRWELAVLRSQQRLLAPPEPGPGAPAQLADLVYGTYAGLAAQVSSGEGVRVSAVLRLGKLQGTPDGLVDALLPGLGDPAGAVRMASFEALRARLPLDKLVAEVLASGQRDVGQAAMELWVDAHGPGVLAPTLLERRDGLEMVALALHQERAGKLATARLALQSASPAARARATALLAEEGAEGTERSLPARELLRTALDSPWSDVRQSAALALATLKDSAAEGALVALLRTDQVHQAMSGLAQLGRPSAAHALLDRVEQDPEGTAPSWPILRLVGEMRLPEVADRLFGLAERRPELAGGALEALRVTSGHDQHVMLQPEWGSSPGDPPPDQSWLRHQHPRHDALLAKLLRWHTDRGELPALQQVRLPATWAQGPEVNGELVRMLGHGHAEIRRLGAGALRWRVRFRGVDPAVLLPALSHRDAHTSFLAAEALAYVGRSEGLLVLLSAMHVLPDLELRRRAVLALGRLADARALEPLLRLVDDPKHELAESAAEAIGHLGHTPAADEILARLLELSRSSQPLASRALQGLRWLAIPSAWARLREAATMPHPVLRAQALSLLRHDRPEPHAGPSRAESREVLVAAVLGDEDPTVCRAAGLALRGMDGPDSLEPDYVFLWARFGSPEAGTLDRLRQRGDPARLVSLVSDPRCRPADADALVMALSHREPLPVEAALQALSDDRPDPRFRGPTVGARLLGHARPLPEHARVPLTRAAERALEAWVQAQRQGPSAKVHEADLTERVRWTLWATARHGLGASSLQRAQTLEGANAVHRAAADALVLGTDAALLEELARTGSAAVRVSSATRLAELDPARAAALVPRVLSDRTTTDRLVQALSRSDDARLDLQLAAAVGQLHLQGLVLPHLAARGAVDALQLALSSPIEAVRLGAVEALGQVASEPAEATLRAFATESSRGEDERKAAWRALRRSQRARARVGAA